MIGTDEKKFIALIIGIYDSFFVDQYDVKASLSENREFLKEKVSRS